MKREVSYQWRLREVMAAHGMFTVTELVPLLHDRGIDLSASQVHRLASGTPERLSLPVLAALCDIFSCTPAELIGTRAQDAPRPQDRHRRRGGQPERAAAEARTAAARGMSDRPCRRNRPAHAAAASSSPVGRTGPRATSARRAGRARWKPTGRAPGAALTGSLPASRRAAAGCAPTAPAGWATSPARPAAGKGSATAAAPAATASWPSEWPSCSTTGPPASGPSWHHSPRPSAR